MATGQASAAGGLDWGVKASLVAYVAGLPDGRVVTTGGAVRLAAGPFRFPLEGLEQGGPGYRARFRGGVRLSGHGGLLTIDLSDPRLDLDDAGAVLSFVVVEAGEDPVRLEIARSTTGVRDGSVRRFSPMRLTADGAFALGALQYSPGQPVDDIEVRLPPDADRATPEHVRNDARLD